MALNAATAALAAAGVQTPRVDAEWIAAHVLGVSRGQLLFTTATPDQAAQISALVARRAERVPLQHLIGAHFYGLELAVGPGVFIPRPETELLVEWGLAHLAADGGPTVVDLCAGSGAIAAAVADNRTDAVVYAVDFSASALMWLSRNVSGLNVHVCHEDVEDPDLLPEIVGRADLVLCNPPYVPAGTEVAPEVAQDPPAAVFAGADGLALMPAVIAAARRLLKPGGYVGIEHDDSHEAAVPALLAQAGLIEVADHQDLAGRPRFATARQP